MHGASMIGIAISILWFLVFLCILVGIGWVILYVLGQLGIPVPPMVVKIVLLVIALLCLIWFLSMLAGGVGALPGIR